MKELNEIFLIYTQKINRKKSCNKNIFCDSGTNESDLF